MLIHINAMLTLSHKFLHKTVNFVVTITENDAFLLRVEFLFQLEMFGALRLKPASDRWIESLPPPTSQVPVHTSICPDSCMW